MPQSLNPFDLTILQNYDEMTTAEVNDILGKNTRDFQGWKNTDFKTRSAKMKKAAEVLRKNIEKFAILMTNEMGKPIVQSRAEIDKCAWVCDYYSENAEVFLKDEIIKTEASKSYVTFQPFGTILSVMPWNFSFATSSFKNSISALVVFGMGNKTFFPSNTGVKSARKTFSAFFPSSVEM